MKKLFYSLFALAMTAMTLTSCEDVPEPYNNPNNNPGGGEVVSDAYLNETFSTSFGKFEVVNTKADGYGWNISYSSAVGTGFLNKVNKESASYLISPEIDLSKSTGAYLQFDYALGYANNDGNDKVLITSNYTGNPATTTWIDITGTLATTSNWEFSTYKKNLTSDFIGKNKVRIAFYFDAPATKSKTWEVKNVIMKEGSVEETPDTPTTPTESAKGSGTYEDPYNVTAAIAKASAEKVWVKAYIVGRLETSPIYDAVFNATGATINTNILVAASASETDSTKCMPVQLPTGDIRSALNLVDNAGNIGKEVLLYGDIATYFKLPGVKNVTYAELGGKSIGTKPGSDPGTATAISVDFKTGMNSWTISDKTKPNEVENVWTNDSKYGMKATAYVSSTKTNYASESWLISPKFDLSSFKTVTFSINYAVNFFASIDEMKKQAVVLASSDGTNWTEVQLSTYPDKLSWTYVDATSDLSAFAGKKNVQIALKYISTSAKAGTWEVASVGLK